MFLDRYFGVPRRMRCCSRREIEVIRDQRDINDPGFTVAAAEICVG